MKSFGIGQIRKSVKCPVQNTVSVNQDNFLVLKLFSFIVKPRSMSKYFFLFYFVLPSFTMLKYAKMLQKNFESDQNQDNSAETFRFISVFCSEYRTDFRPAAESQMSGSDKRCCRGNIDIQKRKCHADCQSIDTGRHCQRSHFLHVKPSPTHSSSPLAPGSYFLR